MSLSRIDDVQEINKDDGLLKLLKSKMTLPIVKKEIESVRLREIIDVADENRRRERKLRLIAEKTQREINKPPINKPPAANQSEKTLLKMRQQTVKKSKKRNPCSDKKVRFDDNIQFHIFENVEEYRDNSCNNVLPWQSIILDKQRLKDKMLREKTVKSSAIVKDTFGW